MLVETHPGGEGEIGADPHEHGSPVAIVDIEIILIHPAPLHLEVPVLLLADGLQDAGGFPGFDNGDHLIGRRFAKTRSEEIVASAFGIGLDGETPFLRSVPHPVVVLVGNVMQHLAAHRVEMAVGPEEPHDPFGLLEGLDDSI